MKNYNYNDYKNYNIKYEILEYDYLKNKPQDSGKRAPIDLVNAVVSESKETSFVKEIVSWLQDFAPAKLTVSFVLRLRQKNYEDLCALVYSLHFRASALVEDIMMLGPSNEFVVKYFRDFPPR